MKTYLKRLPEVLARTGLSRATIYQHIKAGRFPVQIRLGIRTVGWIESEINEYRSDNSFVIPPDSNFALGQLSPSVLAKLCNFHGIWHLVFNFYQGLGIFEIPWEQCHTAAITSRGDVENCLDTCVVN